MQEGTYVGMIMEVRKTAETVKPSEYFDKGTMVTVGYRSAVADAFGMKFTRFIGCVMWAFIHVLYLIGWGNRLGTVNAWALRHLVRAEPGIITVVSAKEELAKVPVEPANTGSTPALDRHCCAKRDAAEGGAAP
jgi:NADH:ubiquinone reductase (H+-translocating)